MLPEKAIRSPTLSSSTPAFWWNTTVPPRGLRVLRVAGHGHLHLQRARCTIQASSSRADGLVGRVGQAAAVRSRPSASAAPFSIAAHLGLA